MDIKLVGFKPSGDRFQIPLTQPSTVLGRGEDCDVRVPVSSISRKHCVFTIQSGHVRVRDLGSANGTFINNNRVSEVRLSPGDSIVLGPLVMMLQIDGKPAEKPSPKLRAPAGAPADMSEPQPAVTEEDLVAQAVSLDEAPIDLGAPAAPADDEGPISLADDSADHDPFADLLDQDAGEAVSAADVLGDSVDQEIDPIAALEMLTGETDQPEDEELPDIDDLEPQQ